MEDEDKANGGSAGGGYGAVLFCPHALNVEGGRALSLPCKHASSVCGTPLVRGYWAMWVMGMHLSNCIYRLDFYVGGFSNHSGFCVFVLINTWY